MNEMNQQAFATINADGGVTVRTPAGALSPGRLDLAMNAGTNWDMRVTWIDATETIVDLSDINAWTADFEIRAHSAETPLVDLDTANGGVTGYAQAPNLRITRTAAQTAAMTWLHGRYGLSVTRSSDGMVFPLLWGYATLNKLTVTA